MVYFIWWENIACHGMFVAIEGLCATYEICAQLCGSAARNEGCPLWCLQHVTHSSDVLYSNYYTPTESLGIILARKKVFIRYSFRTTPVYESVFKARHSIFPWFLRNVARYSQCIYRLNITRELARNHYVYPKVQVKHFLHLLCVATAVNSHLLFVATFLETHELISL